MYDNFDQAYDDRFSKLNETTYINLKFDDSLIEIKEVVYYNYINLLQEIGGLKALLSGFALLFTTVYLSWLEDELFIKFGKKKGCNSKK